MKRAFWNVMSLLLLVSLLTTSCANDGELYVEAADKILQNYGGELAFGEGMGVGVGSKGNQYKYLNVELSGSSLLHYGLSPDLVMTHIAAEFAKTVPDDITEIQVELSALPSEDGPMDFARTTSVEQAKWVNEKEAILHRCIEYIGSSDIPELTKSFTDEFSEWFLENDGEAAIREINALIGDYRGSMFRGYDLVAADSVPDKELLAIYGLIMGADENFTISVLIDPEDSSDRSVVGIGY